MTLAILALLSAAPAGVVDKLSDQDSLLAICTRSAQQEQRLANLDGVIQVWSRCADEARKRGLADLLPTMVAMVDIASVERDYAALRSRDRQAYARVVLVTAAQHPEAHFPAELLSGEWHALLSDPDSRFNLSGVLSVAVRWIGAGRLTRDERIALDERIRRYVGDLGIKSPPGDTERASASDLLILVEPRIRELKPRAIGDRASLHVYEVTLLSQPLSFRALHKGAQPVSATGQGIDSRPTEARNAAIDAACRIFADELLARIVTVVFRDATIPPP